MDKEEKEKQNTERMIRNETSWQSTKFYEANLIANMKDFLSIANPSTYINESPSKSIVVLNPTLDVTIYKRGNHRHGEAILAEIKSYIHSNKKTLTHPELLTKAVKCYMHQGFWLLSCKKEHYWDYYFEKIVTHMYDNCKKKVKDYQFVNIETRWNSSRKMGVIMISLPYYSNVDFIDQLGEIIRALIDRKDITNGYVSPWLSFKPQFYLESGFDLDFTHDSKTNIYNKNLASKKGDKLVFSEGMHLWLKGRYV